MLFEGAVVSIIKQHGGDYGLQKLFGTFGAVIFGPLSGVLIDFGHDYSGVIILYFCLRAATALCILKLDLNFKVIYLSNFSCMFLNPNIFSNLNTSCSNLSYLRNLQEQVKKSFCYQKLFV